MLLSKRSCLLNPVQQYKASVESRERNSSSRESDTEVGLLTDCRQPSVSCDGKWPRSWRKDEEKRERH